MYLGHPYVRVPVHEPVEVPAPDGKGPGDQGSVRPPARDDTLSYKVMEGRRYQLGIAAQVRAPFFHQPAGDRVRHLSYPDLESGSVVDDVGHVAPDGVFQHGKGLVGHYKKGFIAPYHAIH